MYFLSVDGHLGYFYFLAIVTNAAINMCVQTSHRGPAFFLVYAPKWNCWLMGNSFLKIFKEPLYLYHFTFLLIMENGPFFPHSHQYLLFSIF